MNKIASRWSRGGLMWLCFCVWGTANLQAQVTSRYVIGSYGGQSSLGGWLYSYHLGEPFVGTGTTSTMIATVGFLQPQELSILGEASQLTLRGHWEEGDPQLSFRLEAAQAPASYQIWRGSALPTLALYQPLPGGAQQGKWTDPDAAGQSQWYYQLKARLPDGQVILSNPVLLRNPAVDARWRVFPNPASDRLHVVMLLPQTQGPLHLRLSNTLGQAVWQMQRSVDANQLAIQIPVASLAEGIYLLEAWTLQQRWRQWVRVGK